MKQTKINWIPVAGGIALTLFYLLSLRYRGLFTIQECDYTLMLKGIFPRLSGTFLPKLPAALATLVTGLILFFAAVRLRLLHPGNAAAMYLCFPLTWWVGTSASSAPVLSLFIVIAAAGLFIAHRERNVFWKICGFAAGLAGAAAAAYLAQTGFFNWTGAVMAVLPLLFLTFAVRLEKLDDRGIAGRKLNVFTVICSVFLLLLMALLLAPSVCRFLKIAFPAQLTFFYAGERLYLPAAALLIPLVWFFMALKVDKAPEKVGIICFATALMLLFLPPTLPWQRMSRIPQSDGLMKIYPEIMVNNPVFFGDNDTASAVSLQLNVPVRMVGRRKNELPPVQLKEKILEAVAKGRDAVVFSDRGELESFLPENRHCIRFTSQKKYKVFLFKGDKK